MPADVGVLAVIATPAPTLPAPARFHVLLDDLQDPGNVGTILRTAAAAGVEQVLLSKHCAFAWSPKVLRAGQGAHFLTTIVEDVDLPAWAGNFRAGGGQVLATAAGGACDLYDAPLRDPLGGGDRQRRRRAIAGAGGTGRRDASPSPCPAAWNRSMPRRRPPSCCTSSCAGAAANLSSVDEEEREEARSRCNPRRPRRPARSSVLRCLAT